MRHRWAYLPEQVHAQGGDLPGRHRAVPSWAVQQYFGPQGELPSLVRLCAARRTGLRKRRKRLQVYVSDEAAHLRVRRVYEQRANSAIIAERRNVIPCESRRRVYTFAKDIPLRGGIRFIDIRSRLRCLCSDVSRRFLLPLRTRGDEKITARLCEFSLGSPSLSS